VHFDGCSRDIVLLMGRISKAGSGPVQGLAPVPKRCIFLLNDYLYNCLCATCKPSIACYYQTKIIAKISYKKVLRLDSNMQHPSATLASITVDTHPSNNYTTSDSAAKADKTAGTKLTGLDTEPPFSTFTHTQKKFIVLTISFIGLLSPFSASIYFPAINTLAKDLHVSTTDINLTVTTYLVSCCIFQLKIDLILTSYCRSSKLLVQHYLAISPTSKAEDQLISAVLLFRS
jgi:hypothetical protein